MTLACVFHSLPLIHGRKIQLGGSFGRPVRSRKDASTSKGVPSHSQRLIVGSDSLGSSATSIQSRSASVLPTSNQVRREVSTWKPHVVRPDTMAKGIGM